MQEIYEAIQEKTNEIIEDNPLLSVKELATLIDSDEEIIELKHQLVDTE